MSTVDADQAAVTGAELASFTRQLGAMLHAGVNVLRALRIASQYTGNNALIDAARSLARSLEDGKELHQAIGRHPELFDPFYIEMVRQGEADGTLGQTLLGVADYLDHLTLPPAPPVQEGSATGTPLLSVASGRPIHATLGMLALGAAVVAAAVAGGLLESRWYLPFALAWAAYCFFSAGPLTSPATAAVPRAAVPTTLPPQPHKSAQRRAAETEGMVRSALQEQEEEAESRSASAQADAGSKGGPALAPELLLPPDERTPPRFEL